MIPNGTCLYCLIIMPLITINSTPLIIYIYVFVHDCVRVKFMVQNNLWSGCSMFKTIMMTTFLPFPTWVKLVPPLSFIRFTFSSSYKSCTIFLVCLDLHLNSKSVFPYLMGPCNLDLQKSTHRTHSSSSISNNIWLEMGWDGGW